MVRDALRGEGRGVREEQTVEASIQYTVACLVRCLWILRRKNQVSIYTYIYVHTQEVDPSFVQATFHLSPPPPRLSEWGHIYHDLSYRALIRLSPVEALIQSLPMTLFYRNLTLHSHPIPDLPNLKPNIYHPFYFSFSRFLCRSAYFDI